MRAISAVFLVVLWGCLLASCVSRASMDTLHRRASFELDCPPDQVRTFQIDDRTVLVEGCDQRATYVEQCERFGEHNQMGECHWMLDHKREQRPPTAPPAVAR